MPQLLTAALKMHQAGQFGSAARLYQAVLKRDKENANVLHLLGLLYHQQGHHAQAIELIGRALALRPDVAAFHANLAEAYRALGQTERAASCCRTALRLRPDYPEALSNLGLALQAMGQHAEAAENLRRALELRPDFASAHTNLAIGLRELKQLDEALTHFRRAVELAPADAPARTNLGQALIDLGQAEEALPHCREAVRLQPGLAVAHHNLGNALRALGQLAEASCCYLEALRLDCTLARAHANLGLVLQEEGQLAEALACLEQSTELEPENAAFWQYLAEYHQEQEDAEHAMACWRRALALNPNHAPLHNALGRALQDEGFLIEAGEHYRTALQLQPALAVAQLNLGSLHEELGDMADAEAAFRAALHSQPTFALPYAGLATLLRDKLPAADQAALEERLTAPQLEKRPRARLLFARAHVLDARGDFESAAHCLRQANALALEVARGRRDYSPIEHEQFVDNLVAAFNPEFFERIAGWGLDSRRPVFVFGLPRSGTTLIEQVLASHSRVHGAGELRLARQTFDAMPAATGRSDAPLRSVAHLDRAVVRRLADTHLNWLQTLFANEADRVVDKMPDNYLYLGLLTALFPSATFIHCRRDLRDVAFSCWMTDFRRIRWANDLEHIASRIQQYGRVMDHWRAVLPATIHDVAYEDAVADLEGVARRLLTACGLDWEPACLEYHRTRRPVRTASVVQVRQPIYKHSVARWKNYESDLGDWFVHLSAWLARTSPLSCRKDLNHGTL